MKPITKRWKKLILSFAKNNTKCLLCYVISLKLFCNYQIFYTTLLIWRSKFVVKNRKFNSHCFQQTFSRNIFHNSRLNKVFHCGCLANHFVSFSFTLKCRLKNINVGCIYCKMYNRLSSIKVCIFSHTFQSFWNWRT